MNLELIEKLEKKINYKLNLFPVFNNDKNLPHLKNFLNKQKYLDPKKIFLILKNIYLQDSPIGYILQKNDLEIVGFLGTIFSKRKINNLLIDHCYLHSWIVDTKYRTQSFRLITPVLKKKVFTSTYSPIKTLEGLYKKLEFLEKPFNTKFIFTLPLKISSKDKLNITEDVDIFKDILNEKDKYVFKNHLPLENKIIFIYLNNNIEDYIFIILKKKFKKMILPIIEINFVSDKEKFKKNETNINFALISKFKTPFFVENYFDDRSIFSKKYFFSKIIKKKAYFNNLPKNFEFDFLYSEF